MAKDPSKLRHELLSQLAEPLVGEALFDCLADLVFFVKNSRYEYVVVNQALVERCGLQRKEEVLGRRADEVFPSALGQTYRAQDERVLRSGEAIRDQLELHFYHSGGRGWCVTNKLPLRNRAGEVIGLVGISRDLPAGQEKGGDYAQVARAVQRIQSRYHEPLRVRELAAHAGLSEYQFEQRVRRIFQLTAGQLLQKTRMEQAVRLLRASDRTIAEIALDCGYSDQSAFTRQFRQTVGLSPTQYRRGERNALCTQA
ncbi:MAG TPA: AraC family transcriptional regulator [Verrucomicrobiae bacterium]|nr:AraC family transcriptional regulator [Verrucomicrobiae bacterium]